MTDRRIQTRRSFCRLCPCLCGLLVTTDNGHVVSVKGDPDHPVTRGYTCPKGRALGVMQESPSRLDQPSIGRPPQRRWVRPDEMVRELADNLESVISAHGPDSVAAYFGTASAFDPSGRRTVERFLRAIGSKGRYTTATVDTPSKPLVAELMSGFAGLTPAIDEENATLCIMAGVNPVVSHGHVNALPMPTKRLKWFTAEDRELWVIDPRRSETAQLATRHLAPIPGSDYAVFAYLVRELLIEGADWAFLESHAMGVEALADAVRSFDLERAAEVSGLRRGDLEDLLDAVRRHGRVAAQTGTGVSMSVAANATEWLVWALHIVTGSYDRPGGMWFHPGFFMALDARSNLGSSDGRAAPGPRTRPELPRRWGEYPSGALLDEIEQRSVRALIVVGANPLTSLPETDRLACGLRGLDALVVGDILATETSELATHVIPCAGPLERADVAGSVDLYQNQVVGQLTHAVVPLGGGRRSMWWWWAKVAERLGLRDVLPDGLVADETSDEDLIRRAADRGRMSFDELEAAGGAVKWATSTFGWVTTRVLPQGRWRLAPDELVAELGRLDVARSLVLVPRRQRHHLNSQLTEGAGPRAAQRDHPLALMNAADARQHGISDGGDIEIESAHGSMTLEVSVTDDIRQGVISVPHGFASANVCRLTSAALVDPLTGMVLQSGLPVVARPASRSGGPAPDAHEFA